MQFIYLFIYLFIFHLPRWLDSELGRHRSQVLTNHGEASM